MEKTASYWIKKLNLSAHPEGGYFRETYRAEQIIEKNALPDRYAGSRHMSTAIYFLLKSNQVSQIHKIKSDEIWHFYSGSPLTIHIIDPKGKYSQRYLGPEAVLQAVVTAGCWFGATVDMKKTYSLVGCTVSPGFDFEDFEMGKRKELLAQYPDHSEIIKKLT